jgi:hypothetical protein
MLGWEIRVYRQPDRVSSPATAGSAEGTLLSGWRTGLGGLDWIDELVTTGKAIDLGGNGYPRRYRVMAGYILPRVTQMSSGANDQNTGVDGTAIFRCRLDEWLLVEAWDQKLTVGDCFGGNLGRRT